MRKDTVRIFKYDRANASLLEQWACQQSPSSPEELQYKQISKLSFNLYLFFDTFVSKKKHDDATVSNL